MQTSPVSALTADEHKAFRELIDRQAGFHNVRIRVAPHLHDFVVIDRGGHPNRIFVPQPGAPCLSILAVKGVQVVATWACTVFDTGHENLSEFLRHSTFYPGGGEDDWMFTGEALDQAKQMIGTIVYCGGLYVAPEHRGEGNLGPWWSRNVGQLGRSIMADRIDADWYWLMSDIGKVSKKVAPTFGLKRLSERVDWKVQGQSRDGSKVLGVQDRDHLAETVRLRLEQSRR